MPSTTTTPTYTTLPIPLHDVVSRSTQNLSASLSRCRNWPEFAATSALDLPPSIPDSILRFKRNAVYFSVNYAVIVTACAAFSLIGTPVTLILVGLVFYLWLILHFFREDPLLILGRHVTDWAVILGLVVLTVAALYVTGPMNSLSVGISVGLLVCVVHGVLRNPEGLFMDENDAASTGLIANAGGGGGGGSSSRVSINPPV